MEVLCQVAYRWLSFEIRELASLYHILVKLPPIYPQSLNYNTFK
jgi:hypothetical protein